MIKNKRHLFEGCPESPVGLVSFADVCRARHLPQSDDLYCQDTAFVAMLNRSKPNARTRKHVSARELSDKFRATLASLRVEPPHLATPAAIAEPEHYVVPHIPEPVAPKTRADLSHQLPINYDNTLTEEAARAGVTNTVNLPERLLAAVSAKTKRISDETSRFMLRQVAPAMLSYSAASKIVGVALKDGLSIDVDVDEGMNSVLRELTRLDLTFHYVRRTALPKSVKQQYMNKLTELLVVRSVADLEKFDKSKQLKAAAGEISSALEGIVVRGRRGAATSKRDQPRRGGSTEGNEGLREFLDQNQTQQRRSALGVRGARHSYRPLEGGI